MKTRNVVLISLGMIAAAVLYTVYVFPVLPEKIPCHWNIRGEVDGWMLRGQAAVFGPGMMAAMLALMLALPRLSPKPFSTEGFLETLNTLTLLIVGLMGYIHIAMLQSALHPEMDSGRIVIGGIFVFFGFLGNLMGRVRRNLWVGVRTPWTLASDRVWVATHRMAARLYTAAGFICALLVWAGLPVERIFPAFLFAALAPVGYSWWIHRSLGGKDAEDEASDGGADVNGGTGPGGASLLVILALAGGLATPAQAESREVTFPGAGGLTLRGTLLLPDAAASKRFPAVLLLPGSGAPDRDGNAPPYLVSDLLKRMAQRLASEGIASLRFDKRSVAVYRSEWPKTVEKVSDFFSWANFSGDVKSAYRFLREQPMVDPKRIGVAGHSEGGLLTLQLTHDLTGDDSPKAIALLATAGRTLDLVIREQIKAGLEQQISDENLRNQYLDYTEKAIAQIKKDATLPPDPPPGLLSLFNPSTVSLLQSYFTIEPTALAAKYAGPVVIVQGDRDTQVSAERDAPRLRDAFQARKSGSVRLVIVSGVGHQFQTGNPNPISTNQKNPPPTDPAFLSAVELFFKKEL